jgi:methyltransferase (TIGR00027 family)
MRPVTLPGMRRGRASITAALVSAGRGVGVKPGGCDPTAAALLPWPGRALVRLAETAMPVRELGRVLSLGMVDHVCLRTAAIDAAVTRAVHLGCGQLVILGAGLDGRAWRLDTLRSVDVFEVDHQDTQVAKRARVERLDARAASVTFVPVDFARDRLAQRLQATGHDASKPTVWIWEGVTPYLPRPAIEATLRDIGSTSATNSTLAMTYVTPHLVPLGRLGVQKLARAAFRALGEPLLGAMAEATVADCLQSVGFRVEQDHDARSWASYGPGNPRLSYAFRAERLVIAAKVR